MKPGDKVTILGRTRTLVRSMPNVAGGWEISRPLEGYRFWNVDSMKVWRPVSKGVTTSGDRRAPHSMRAKQEIPMVTQKKRHLYPTQQFQALEAGRDLAEGVPVGWLGALETKLKAAVGTESERNSIRVYGFEHLSADFTDELTPEEQARDEIDTLRAQRAEVLARLPPDGEAMSADQVKALRAALSKG